MILFDSILRTFVDPSMYLDRGMTPFDTRFAEGETRRLAAEGLSETAQREDVSAKKARHV